MAGIHPSQEPLLMKWYSSLGTEARVHFTELSYKVFREWPSRKSIPKEKLSELQYAALIKVLKSERQKEDQLHRKGVSDKTPPEKSVLKENVFKSLKPPKKEQEKRRLIRLRALPAIKEMRATIPPTSWRDISEYIRRAHKKKISHVYIRKIYDELMS
jgi:hypothetical protein